MTAGAFVRPDPITIVGHDLQTLKAGWGRPDRKEVKSDGGEVWIYSRTFTGPSTPGPLFRGYSTPTQDRQGLAPSPEERQGVAPSPEERAAINAEKKTCETRFEISPDRQIIATTTSGAGCAIGPARA